jgi:hypothetical protein
VQQKVCHQLGIDQEPANEMIVWIGKVNTGHSAKSCRTETTTLSVYFSAKISRGRVASRNFVY